MFLHLLVGEKVRGATVLCEKGKEGGSTRAIRVAHEAFKGVDVNKMGERDMGGLGSPRSGRETPRSASQSRRGRSGTRGSSLKRGNTPGEHSSVRISDRKVTSHTRSRLFDLEMPHKCGLTAFLVVDCTLVFLVVARHTLSRASALPLLRALRREFLYYFRPDQLANLVPQDCGGFSNVLQELLTDANRGPGSPAIQSHFDLPCMPTDITTKQTPVRVNIYNIIDPSTNSRFQFFGVGIHHTGVEILGKEWSFGGLLPGADTACKNETGVFCVFPKTGLPSQSFKESILLGHTEKAPEDIDYILSSMKRESAWRAGEYHLLNHNCNDFCTELVKKLGGWEVPSWVNRAARVTSSILPDMLVGQILTQMTTPNDSNTQGKPRIKQRVHRRSIHRDPNRIR